MTDYTKLAEDTLRQHRRTGNIPLNSEALAHALKACDRERRRAIDAAMAERLKRREAEALTQDYRNALLAAGDKTNVGSLAEDYEDYS